MKKVLIFTATIVLLISVLIVPVSASAMGPNPIDTNNLAGEAENIANRNQQLTEGTNLAGGLENSKIVQGTKNLFSDAQKALIGLAILIGGGFITYYCIRKGMADEQEQARWKNRITIACVCTVGAVVASSVLPIIVGYYQ